VVDDLSFSFESLVRSRAVLAHLIDRQLGPGDLAAIIRTGGGVGNLQQFTSDKLLLQAAARGIPFGLARMGALGPAAAGGSVRPADLTPGRGDAAAPGANSPEGVARTNGEASPGLGEFLGKADVEYRVHRALGTLSVLEGIVKALGRMPGRKSLVLLSEGFQSTDASGDTGRVDARLRALAEQANRGSIVFYTVDPSGLQTLQGGPGEMSNLFAATAAQREIRAGLVRMADATGGLAVFDSNDLDGAVGRVFDDQRGYYLLGYQPGAASGRPGLPQLHRLSLKVTRPGLRVRSRRAFAAGGRDAAEPATDSFAEALLSPFAATEIPIKLTVLFNHDAKRGAFLRCLVYMDARQLTLQEEANGARTVKVEAGALGVEASGRVAQKAGGLYAFTVPKETADAAQGNGLVLTLDLPVKPGPYQVRTAVRDVANSRAGSASQFVSVPDMAKRPLALSGLFMSGSGDPPDPEATPAVRRFRPGSAVAYAFGVYNAQVEKASGRPRLSAELHLFRDGKRVEAVPIRTDPTLPSQEGVLAVSGSLRLGAALEPGLYLLEARVEDALRPPKERVAVQWIDFEVQPGRDAAR